MKRLVFLILLILPVSAFADGEKDVLKALEKVRAKLEQGDITQHQLAKLVTAAKTEVTLYKETNDPDSMFSTHASIAVGNYEILLGNWEVYTLSKNLKKLPSEYRDKLSSFADSIPEDMKSASDSLHDLYGDYRETETEQVTTTLITNSYLRSGLQCDSHK